MASANDHLVRRLIAGHAGEVDDVLGQRRRGVLDRGGDLGLVEYTQFADHDVGDGGDEARLELLHKDAVVDCVGDAAADDADGQGQGRDRGDDVVGADDGGDDAGRDDDAADAETANEQEGVHGVQVVRVGARQGPRAGCHEDAGPQQDGTDVAFHVGQQCQANHAATEDGETDGERADAVV